MYTTKIQLYFIQVYNIILYLYNFNLNKINVFTLGSLPKAVLYTRLLASPNPLQSAQLLDSLPYTYYLRIYFTTTNKRGRNEKDSSLLEIRIPKRVGTTLFQSTLRNIYVIKVTKILYKVVSPRKTLIAYPRVVLYSIRVPRSTDFVYYRLVLLQISQAGKVSYRDIVRKIILLYSNYLVSS